MHVFEQGEGGVPPLHFHFMICLLLRSFEDSVIARCPALSFFFLIANANSRRFLNLSTISTRWAWFQHLIFRLLGLLAFLTFFLHPAEPDPAELDFETEPLESELA